MLNAQIDSGASEISSALRRAFGERLLDEGESWTPRESFK